MYLVPNTLTDLEKPIIWTHLAKLNFLSLQASMKNIHVTIHGINLNQKVQGMTNYTPSWLITGKKTKEKASQSLNTHQK